MGIGDQESGIGHLPPLRDVVAGAGLEAKKGLGQHFLLDMNLTRKIVRQAGDLTGVTVFEIGPGPGGLTRALLESPARQVIAIEKDPRCVAALAPLVEAARGRLRLIEGDALDIALPTLADAPRKIVANLPYNVGTVLLVAWLKQIEAFQSLTLMFQVEVADRLLAQPGTKAYGRLSVLTQSVAAAKKALALPAAAFTPPPKIDSAVVHITPRPRAAEPTPLANLERLTAAAFGQRRKMLRSSLKGLIAEQVLIDLGIPPTARAENVSVALFERLATRL
jgi:16S rRNA (adenine1518-N6/adenine1519-N6)-dimethyltransferase